MNKSVHFLCFFFFLSVFFQSGLSRETSQTEKKPIEPLSESAKQWLDEVVPYIITNVEKEIFKNLPNEEERGKFIENFWKKRDPEPRTPENEFKLDYYRRIALANKFFSSGGIQGWRTDRGRIYIILGPPNEIQRDMTPSGSYATAFHGPKEVWNYWGLPNPKLPYNVEFVFVDKLGTENYVLEQSLKLTQGGSTPFSLDSSHYYFDYLEILTEATRNPFEGLDKLKGVITTQVTYDRIPIEYTLYRLKGHENKSYVPVIVRIPSAALTPKVIEGQNFQSMTLMIVVSNHLGQIISERSKDFNFKAPATDSDPSGQKTHQAQISLALEPDAQKIHLLVLDNFSGKIGTRHEEISVPEFGEEFLSISDIILSSKRENIQDNTIAGDQELASQITSTFKAGEEMDVLVEIYGLALDATSGHHSFAAEYLFLDEGKILARIPYVEEAPSAEKDVRIQSTLKLKNFKPGDYKLRFRVIDKVTGSEVQKEIPYRVFH
ncbi:MAG: GWxTD domain-containing protein [Candidatus Aminicenantes bacterium]|nr:GWxTD domain-containing protein [Candidatus Aminicenantes bacterium]